jgi:hypothetical protein
MTPEQVDEFLAGERTCRMATIDGKGRPHVTPLWFVWDGRALWFNSLVTSQRWTDLRTDPHVAVVIDAGDDYLELRGVELRGSVVIVGDVPRSATADPLVDDAERRFGDKYADGSFQPDGRHAWLRLDPDKLVSWDFRKLRRDRGAPSHESGPK